MPALRLPGGMREAPGAVVMETGQASVSMLQRRLKLGYSRAARIVDEMEQRGMMSVSDIQAMYAAGGFQKSPYQLRAEALDRPLSKEEAVRVLIHLAQRRGYKSNSTAEAAKDEKETGKVKTAIEENVQQTREFFKEK